MINFQKKSKKFSNMGGFTLIELLLVISLIAVLAGVMLAVLNPNFARNRAEDATRIANLERLAQGLEAFYAGEGFYPTDSNSNGDPLTIGPPADTHQAALSVYLNEWPSTDYYYSRQSIAASNTDLMCISVPMASITTNYFKYVSTTGAGITGNTACIGRVLKDCDENSRCDNDAFDISSCMRMDDVSCT